MLSIFKTSSMNCVTAVKKKESVRKSEKERESIKQKGRGRDRERKNWEWKQNNKLQGIKKTK